MKEQIVTQDGEVYSYSKTGKAMPERGWTLTPDGWLLATAIAAITALAACAVIQQAIAQ